MGTNLIPWIFNVNNHGAVLFLPKGYQTQSMQTVFETRRSRLRLLIEQYGSISSLNVAIGWEATNARLSQIQNRSIRSDRGTAYEMGDVTAREIEAKLGLEVGWMDTPPSYAELHGDDSIVQMEKIMEAMPKWQREQAVKVIAALTEPARSNGTED